MMRFYHRPQPLINRFALLGHADSHIPGIAGLSFSLDQTALFHFLQSPRGSHAIKLDDQCQIRRSDRIGFHQGRQNPPLPPRDAKQPLAPTQHRRTRSRQQLIGLIRQHIAHGLRIDQIGAMRLPDGVFRWAHGVLGWVKN